MCSVCCVSLDIIVLCVCVCLFKGHLGLPAELNTYRLYVLDLDVCVSSSSRGHANILRVALASTAEHMFLVCVVNV